nr:ABC transporter permease [Candidatus Njordarchaeota archaeon]
MQVNFMDEIKKLPIVVRYELLKQVRRFRLYGLLLIGSVATGLAMALGAVYLPSIGTLDARALSYFIVYGGQVSFFGLIAGVFVSGDAIASEFEHKTGYLIFPNPMKRTTLLIGKYLSCCIAATLVVTMPYLIISIGVLALTGQFVGELFLSYAFCVLYTCSIVSLTFVFSSLFKGTMGASVLPFLLMFFVFPIIAGSMELGGVEPFMLLSYSGSIISNIFIIPFPPHKVSIPISVGGTIYMEVTYFYPDVVEGVSIMVCYLVVGLILSILLARRRQMA